MKRIMLTAAVAALAWCGANGAAQADQSSQFRCSYVPWDADGARLNLTYVGPGRVPANAVYTVTGAHGTQVIRPKKAVWSRQTLVVGSPFYEAGNGKEYKCSAVARWVDLDTGVTRFKR